MIRAPKTKNLPVEVWIRNVYRRAWRVGFTVGSQTFTLDYDVETKREAGWMAAMLVKAFVAAGTPTVTQKDYPKGRL